MFDVDPAKIMNFDFYEQYEEYKAKNEVVSINESLKENKRTMFASMAMPYFGYSFLKAEHESVGLAETNENCELGYLKAYYRRSRDIPHKKQLDDLQKQYWELLEKCPKRISKFVACVLFLFIVPGFVYVGVKIGLRAKWKKMMRTEGADILYQAKKLLPEE